MARKRKESAQLGALLAKNLRAKGGSVGFAGAGNKDDAKKVRHSCNNLPLEVLKKMPYDAVEKSLKPDLALQRKRLLAELQSKGLLRELQKALDLLDQSTRLFLRSRISVLEVFFKIAKTLPKEWRHNRWLWREIMGMTVYQILSHAYEKSLRHLRRLARKLADLTPDDDPRLVRAMALAHETGLLQWADHLPHPRADSVEHEVAETLGKLVAYYASGHYWVLARLRETVAQLEEHWKQLHGAA
jgi:hypothetical protein